MGLDDRTLSTPKHTHPPTGDRVHHQRGGRPPQRAHLRRLHLHGGRLAAVHGVPLLGLRGHHAHGPHLPRRRRAGAFGPLSGSQTGIPLSLFIYAHTTYTLPQTSGSPRPRIPSSHHSHTPHRLVSRCWPATSPSRAVSGFTPPSSAWRTARASTSRSWAARPPTPCASSRRLTAF